MVKSTFVLVFLALMLSSFNCQDAAPAEAAPEEVAAVEEDTVEAAPGEIPEAVVAAEAQEEAAPGEIPEAVAPVEAAPEEVAAEAADLAEATPEVAPVEATPPVLPAAAVVAPVPAPVPTTPQVPPAPTSSILPPANLTLYLIEPYFYSTNTSTQIIAYLFCQSIALAGFSQCAIYDSANPATARLIGTEYVVNQTIFSSLPADEQQYWHSHNYGVQSGNIIAPNLSGIDYNNTLTAVAGTYGKAILNWPVAGLPIGIPVILYAFSRPNQFNAAVSQLYDNQTGIPAAQRAANNANITIPPTAFGANLWSAEGVIPQLDVIIQNLPPGLWNLTFAPKA